MGVTSIHGEYEKRANDGDYGSELVKLSWTYDLQDGEDPVTVSAALQGEIRGRVEADLAQSANLKVRRALIRQTRTCGRCGKDLPDSETGYLHAECDAAEKAEREARYQERLHKERERERDDERAEVWARSNENAELAAIRSGSEDDSDDDEDVPL